MTRQQWLIRVVLPVVGLIALGLGIALAAELASDDDDDGGDAAAAESPTASPSPDASGEPGASETGTATETASGTPGTTEPGASGASSGEVSESATPLTVGAAAVIGKESVLYYSLGCYACDQAPDNLYRAFLPPGGDGRLRTENLFRGIDGTPYTWAADWQRGEMVAAVCTAGQCANVEGASPDAAAAVYRSIDGGVSWVAQERGLPANSTFVAFHQGAPVVLTQLTPDPPTQRVWDYNSGEDIAPPREGFLPGFVTTEGLVWRGQDGTTLNATGGVVAAPLFSDGVAGRYTAREPQEAIRFMMWRNSVNNSLVSAFAAEGTSPESPTGALLATWKWPTNDLTVTGAVSPTIVYGHLLLEGPFCGEDPNCDAEDRQFPYESALFDLASGAIQPLAELSEDLDENENPFLHYVATGRMAIVSGAGDCLNVRTEPNDAAPVVGCFPDGTLLPTTAELVEANGRTWLTVRTPDGREGVAASQFLRY